MVSVELKSLSKSMDSYLEEENRRLVIVSNAEPYAHYRDEDGEIKQEKLAGGLTSAMDPLMRKVGGIWIAWGREDADFEVLDNEEKLTVPDEDGYRLRRLNLSDEEIEKFYYGFSNEVLWPLSHSFLEKTVLNDFEASNERWDVYRKVNRKYAEAILDEMTEEDLVWIHDYHLSLVPEMVKEEVPDIDIAFFWHIPWPPWELFRILPWREELMKGMVASNFIGFHTSEAKKNFLECIKVLDGTREEEVSVSKTADVKNKVASVPLGIDYNHFNSLSERTKFVEEARKLKEDIFAEKIILGVDRLDYTKGIPQRLRAFEIFLEKNPDFRGKVTLLQRISPSRENVDEYQSVLDKIHRTVGEINGKYGEPEWNPVKSFYGFLPKQEQLIPYYSAADVALVTSLADGMNLVSKEYIASVRDGVLILSEFAGAAEELKEAIQINPYDIPEAAQAIEKSLTMPREERQKRLKRLKERVRENDLEKWRRRFMSNWTISGEVQNDN